MDFLPRANDGLKCGSCDGPLSIFPIHTNREGKYICGRCPLPSEKFVCGCCQSLCENHFRRNFAYEALASHFDFPCMHLSRGCLEELPPEALKTHEVLCDYKPIKCPTIGCEWQDTADKLRKHYQERHEQLLLANKQEFEITSGGGQYLLEALGELFTVQAVKTSELLHVSTRPVKSSVSEEDFVYDVRFHLRCMHPPADANHICFYYNDATGFPAFNMCQVIVSRKPCVTDNETEPQLHRTVWKSLQCTFCTEHIVSPDRCCCTSLCCETCFAKSSVCPLCQSKFAYQKNLALEEITSVWTFVCKYEGCGRKLTGAEKIGHESVCMLRSVCCPICFSDCKYDGLWRHVKAEHISNVTYNGRVNFGDIDRFVIKNDSCVFLLRDKIEDDSKTKFVLKAVLANNDLGDAKKTVQPYGTSLKTCIPNHSGCDNGTSNGSTYQFPPIQRTLGQLIQPSMQLTPRQSILGQPTTIVHSNFEVPPCGQSTSGQSIFGQSTSGQSAFAQSTSGRFSSSGQLAPNPVAQFTGQLTDTNRNQRGYFATSSEEREPKLFKADIFNYPTTPVSGAVQFKNFTRITGRKVRSLSRPACKPANVFNVFYYSKNVFKRFMYTLKMNVDSEPFQGVYIRWKSKPNNWSHLKLTHNVRYKEDVKFGVEEMEF